ncbi:MAG: hypothetical protein ACI4XH_00050 [Acutalibacteraceae bacterium]
MKYVKPNIKTQKFVLSEPIAADFLSAASDLPGFIDESNTGGDSPGFEEIVDTFRDVLRFDIK